MLDMNSYVRFSGLITSIGEERPNFSSIDYLQVIMWFQFGEVSSESSSWWLGKAV